MWIHITLGGALQETPFPLHDASSDSSVYYSFHVQHLSNAKMCPQDPELIRSQFIPLEGILYPILHHIGYWMERFSAEHYMQLCLNKAKEIEQGPGLHREAQSLP